MRQPMPAIKSKAIPIEKSLDTSKLVKKLVNVAHKGRAYQATRWVRPTKAAPKGRGGHRVNDGVLLAPNGRPSHLSAAQWRQVRTPAFKKWFGDWERVARKVNKSSSISKVVDENGEPMVVYHGTQTAFDTFLYTNDIGYHFGTAEQAGNIANQKGRLGGANIIPVYLNIRNPLKTHDTLWYFDKATATRLVQGGVLTQGEADSILNRKITNKERRAEIHLSDQQIRFARLKDALKKAGYDGIQYQNEVNKEGRGMSWIVFDSSQVKSAIGNTGTFDNSLSDIRKGIELVVPIKYVY